MKKLGTTCEECPANCCTFGTGEKVLTVRKFLNGYMTTDSINTRCENLSKDLKCKLWGTPDLPIECRVHVCHNRSFSPEEVKKINEVQEVTCSYCGCKWMLQTNARRGKWFVTCEVCGEVWKWQATLDKIGKRTTKK